MTENVKTKDVPKKESQSDEKGIERLKSLIESISGFGLVHAIALKEGQDHVPVYHILRLALGLFYEEMVKKIGPHHALTTRGSYKCVKMFDDQTIATPITIRYTRAFPVRTTKTKQKSPYVRSAWKAIFQSQNKELLAMVQFEIVSRPEQRLESTTTSD